MSRFTRGFDLRGTKQATRIILLPFIWIFLLSQTSLSQSQQSSPIIREVSLQIQGQQDGENMAELIQVMKGEPFSLERISQSIKHLYSTGLFSDIKVLREGEKDIRLTYVLTRKFFTRKINILVEEGISQKKLKKALDAVRENSAFSDGMVAKAEEELREALREQGYFDPKIKTDVEKDFKTSSVDILFEVRSSKRYRVKEITFSGQTILPEADLRQTMETKKGHMFVPAQLESDVQKLKRLYNSRHYNRAEVNIKRTDFEKDGVSVELGIMPHERLEVVVKGAEVPLGLLLPIWEERIFEEWGLSEGEAKIINYLRDKGYLFASVHSFIEKKENSMRVVYEVAPDKKYGIQDISFEGLKYFTPEQLRRELGIREKIPFLGWISGKKLFELPQEIEELYKRNGFSQTTVYLNFTRIDDKVTAKYYINEGNQERIKNIFFRGNKALAAGKLMEHISIYPNGPFFRPIIERDVERLENFYLEQGFRGTEIQSSVEKADEDLYSVTFDIQEGKRVKIEKIIIAGNSVTRKSTILRELRIEEGDYARLGLIRGSKRGLENLGIFTEVKIEEISLSPESENLIVSVREGERNYVSLGLGLETKNEPRTFSVWNNEVRLRGTAELIRNNIFGRAAQLSLVGQFSLREKRGVISWEQPYFFGMPLQTYLNAWLEREERTSFSFERRGISLTTIKPLSESSLLLATLRWARTTLFDLQIAESEIDRQYSPFSASSISGSFIWDRRDDPFNPEKGHFFSIAFEWAFPLFKVESDFLKNFIKYQQYIPVIPGVTFSSTFRLGLGRGRMPIHERFFAGGSNSFRGERFDELGPKDPYSLKPVGGKALFLMNLELTVPLFFSFRDLFATLFYDAGNVFAKRKQMSLAAIQDTIGVGLRYRTPLGPIRFELGWNLDIPEGERRVLAFITIGNVF
jgi:outer membrane protein insertion porin family